MQTPTYRAASRELMAQAANELANGDSRQASEKAWGAAAQMVKAIAQDRGWRHDNHFLLYQAVDSLTQETGDRQIISLFHVAGNLETNSYENWQPSESVASGIRAVTRLLEKLEPLLESTQRG